MAEIVTLPGIIASSGHAASLQRWLRRSRPLLADPKVVCGGGFIVALVLVAVFAPWLAPKNPLDQDIMLGTVPPAGLVGAEPGYYLGTDDLGRDVLSRLIGLAAGWYGRWLDVAVSRFVEIWMAFPPVLLSILLVAVIGPGVTSVIFAIVVIDWTRFCRVIRAETQAQAKMDYVTAARAIGFPGRHILFREILPNVMPVIVALISLEAGIAVIVEAILSFVGLSVSSDTPTWGGMIAQGRQIIHQGWWVLIAPLSVLFLTVLAFNMLGEGMRRALDPVMRR